MITKMLLLLQKDPGLLAVGSARLLILSVRRADLTTLWSRALVYNALKLKKKIVINRIKTDLSLLISAIYAIYEHSKSSLLYCLRF